MKIFQTYYPMCRQYGMTEEEFWKSNPRKIEVYRSAWKKDVEFQNRLQYTWWGNYGLSAMNVALQSILVPMFSKGHSSARYISEPIRLFEMTEEEKEEYKEQMTEAFVGWCNAMKDNWESKNKDA